MMPLSCRKDFPIFNQADGMRCVYLDSAASTQKPLAVIEAVSRFYSEDYANIHRGIYGLSERATRLFEAARETVQRFIHAAHSDEIIFVKGTTEAINLVAHSYGRSHFQAGDEIIVSIMEHHANIVPWYLLSQELGLHLKVIPMTDVGELDLDAYRGLFSSKTKLVAISHVSNVLGTINPAQEMVAIAHEQGVPVLLDGAQAVSHLPVDVQALDCDFYAFSGHKLYGPTGIGVLYGKRALLAAMPPYQGGGGMIESVAFDQVTFAKPPYRFEGGTPDIAAAIGFARAIEYVEAVGLQAIVAHDQALLRDAEKKLGAIPDLRLLGQASSKIGVISFVLEGVHPHDIATVLDHEGVMIRAGHHCAMPLMKRLGVPATARASFGIYSDTTDIDALVEAIKLSQRLLVAQAG
jgi:cysteine desulfurase/selenocysteine lyase